MATCQVIWLYFLHFINCVCETESNLFEARKYSQLTRAPFFALGTFLYRAT